MAAFRGMHVLLVTTKKSETTKKCNYQTDPGQSDPYSTNRQMEGRTDRPPCCYASQVTKNGCIWQISPKKNSFCHNKLK